VHDGEAFVVQYVAHKGHAVIGLPTGIAIDATTGDELRGRSFDISRIAARSKPARAGR
jgi:hypothetical protein